ncbi:iron ABC transporter permease [Moritella sp.]|uniref:FecCD family ABC transporter permease n=1 Tax=Moritella sp. TaxID=78556 RepID=UPI001D9E4351|nr:iron ABC transporter permease [Moritella sp.]MCJ8349487.1 iron ABC transporter permease [Moritella sp.]NQZ39198.1 iron ABC transporter permease [Moritella sp.]
MFQRTSLPSTVSRSLSRILPGYRFLGAVFLLTLMLLLVALTHISIGARAIAWEDIFKAIFSFDSQQFVHHIVIKQRLPRLVVAMACGAMLGLAGFSAQKMFQNPLVSSSTLGVSSGAVFFSLCAIYFFNVSENDIFIPAFLGAAIAGLFTLSMTEMMNRSSISKNLHIVLAGSLVSMLFSSLSSFLMQLDPLRFANVQDWLLGDISPADFTDLSRIYPLALLAIGVLLSQGRSLDVMIMGEKQAHSAGVNVTRTRNVTLLCIFLLASLVVSIVGPIGFIGLVVPHISKLFVSEVGNKGAWLSMLIGGLLLSLSDLLARIVIAPKVLIVGGVSASIGSICFLCLLYFMVRDKRMS